MKQEYARLPTDSDVSVASVEWALGRKNKHKELHVSPACEDIGHEIVKAFMSERNLQIDLVVDTELCPHEWFLVEAIGSPG
jgi:hypothetical protein